MTDEPLQSAMLAAAQEIAVTKPASELIWYPDIVPRLTSNYLVHGVISRGSLAVVVGHSGSGKTFTAIDLALSVASGRPWRGRAVKKGVVLYFAAEAGASIAKRVEAWRRHHQVFEADFAIRILPLDLLNRSTPQRLLDLCEQVARERGAIQLIVIDTVSRSMPGGEENSAETMTLYISVCDRIRAETGAAILLVHHKGKDGTKGLRGHSSLRAAVDTEIDITADDHCKVAKITKQRDEESGAEFAFALRQLEVGIDDEGRAVMSCIVVDPAEPEKVDPEKRLTGRQKETLAAVREFIAKWGSDRHKGSTPGKPAVLFEKAVDAIAPLMTGIATVSRQREAARRTIRALAQHNLLILGKTRIWLP